MKTINDSRTTFAYLIVCKETKMALFLITMLPSFIEQKREKNGVSIKEMFI